MKQFLERLRFKRKKKLPPFTLRDRLGYRFSEAGVADMQLSGKWNNLVGQGRHRQNYMPIGAGLNQS
jgi:hypothetical protein